MKILPYRNLTLRSPLTSSVVYQRLADMLGPPQVSFVTYFNTDGRPYNGKATDSGFKTVRTVKGRNSFRPVITGSIVSDEMGSGTVILLQMRLHISVILFVTAWCSFVLYASLAMATKWIEGHKGAPWPLIIPFVMILFFILLTVITFYQECDRSTADLQKLWEAQLQE